MAITSNATTSFKTELLTGTFTILLTVLVILLNQLYIRSATLGATTTAFTTSQEASGTNYTSGGANLTNVTPSATGNHSNN